MSETVGVLTGSRASATLKTKLCVVGRGTADWVESRVYWEDWEHERKCLGVVGSGGGLVVEFKACRVP